MSEALKRFRCLAIIGLFMSFFATGLDAANEPSRSSAVTLPESTAIYVTLNGAVGSDRSQPGDHFEATLSKPVIVDGRTIIPEGARATGVVVDAKRSGMLMGRAHLQLALESVEVGGDTYEIRTATDTKIEKRHGKHNLSLIGGGVGGGLLVGAIAAGGSGALVGGPIGAGVGAVAVIATNKRDIRLPAETHVTFELAMPAIIGAGS